MFRSRQPPAGSRAATRRAGEKGYTFIEALLQLVILSLFFILFAGFFRYSSGLIHHAGDSSSVEWELFRYELAQYLKNVEDIQVMERGSSLSIISGNKVTEIGHYPSQSMIRKRVNDKGHEPMLTGVRSVRFTLSENELSIRVVLEDGTERGTMHYLLPDKE